MNRKLLTGRDQKIMVDMQDLVCSLHPEVIQPLLSLQKQAQSAGQTLAVASGYRSFARQQTIWNDKIAGKRTVYDRDSKRVDLAKLNDWDKVQTVLIWSALPGASRHHWGTDFDVFNPQLVGVECQLQLSQEEYLLGEQQSFCQWLDSQLSQDNNFFRPYVGQRREGVAPEPWHISYRPLAQEFENAMTPDVLADALEDADILLKDCILDHLETIISRYVRTA